MIVAPSSSACRALTSSPDRGPTGHFLVIEASGVAGSLALLTRPALGHPLDVRATADVLMGASRTDALTPAVTALLADQSLRVDDLEGVVCGAGPGSFTSLRIAASLAKGLVFGSGSALYAVPSLALAVPRSAAGAPTPGDWLITADALRGEVFARPMRVDADGYIVALDDDLRTLPDAIPAAWHGLPRCHVTADGPVRPRAEMLRWLARWDEKGPVAVDSWEPAYGRLAEAQVQWEARHGTPLPTA